MPGNHLKNNSLRSLEAAGILRKNPNYHHGPSVHCSYYSCIQLIKYWLFTLGETDESLERMVNLYKTSFHTLMKDKVHGWLCRNALLEEAKEFRNEFLQLKEMRVEADYKDLEILADRSQKANELAESITSILERKVLK